MQQEEVGNFITISQDWKRLTCEINKNKPGKKPKKNQVCKTPKIISNHSGGSLPRGSSEGNCGGAGRNVRAQDTRRPKFVTSLSGLQFSSCAHLRFQVTEKGRKSLVSQLKNFEWFFGEVLTRKMFHAPKPLRKTSQKSAPTKKNLEAPRFWRKFIGLFFGEVSFCRGFFQGLFC